METPRYFIDLHHIDSGVLQRILEVAKELKAARRQGGRPKLLEGRTLAMIFEKNSTRTRVSFEVAMLELGGNVLSFSSGELQLGRGETVADTARVLSRYVDAIMLRCHAHRTLEELAGAAAIPVINGLTNGCHPCQIMADLMTFEEKRGPAAGKTFAWVGDGNNMANTFIAAAGQFGLTLRLACPPQLAPSQGMIKWARERGATVTLTENPVRAVAGADAVITDTWVSMGDRDTETRYELLAPYQVNAALMAQAGKDALFMHCLPAHRGEEVTAEVIDGPQSAVWDEAENRLHVQKAILLWCLHAL